MTLCGKFRNRERHGVEYAARIVDLRRNALLLGYGIFGSIQEILSRSYDADDREKTDGDHQILSVLITVAYNSVKTAYDRIGKIASAATTATLRAILDHLNTKYNGLDHVYNSSRRILRASAGLGKRAVARRAAIRTLKGTNAILASEKNHRLFKNCNAVKFMRTTAHTCLKGKLDVELDVHGIKAAVKANRRDTDVSTADL